MKNNMKKIIIAFLGLAFLFIGQSAFASVSWNTDPQDCNGIGVGNFTTGVGIPSTGSNNCWNLTNVSANSGDSVNVELYYHNTGSEPATNVRVAISASPSLGQATSTHTFSATLTSNQNPGGLSLGSVQVNLSSPQTLSFGSTYWYANQSSNYTVSGSQIMSGGLTLGTINSGWPSQGTTVTSFRVGSSVAPSNCTISSFTGNGSTSPSISSGDPVNLTWSTYGCTSVSLSSFGNVNQSGSQTVYPSANMNYVLTAYDSSGMTQTRTVYVNVNNNNYNNCTISSFTGNGSTSPSISSGDPVNLHWNTYGCDHINITNLGNVNPSDNETVYPNYDTNYVLTAYSNYGGTQTKTVYVNVDNNYNNNCRIEDFYASPTSVNSGQPVTLTWRTQGCSYVNISNVGSNLPTNYSRIIYPTSTHTYTLTGYGYNNYYGNNPTDSVTVYVNNYTPIYPQPVYNNCAVTTIATNVSRNSVTLNGLVNGYSSSTYFTYGTTVNMGYSTSPRSVSGTTFSESLTGLSSNTIYFYRLVSNCGGGTSQGSIEVFQTSGAQTTTTRTVYVQGTTVVGTSSPIMLKIEDRYKSIRVGDIIDYTITYKNIGSKKLTNSLLQVILPKGISFLNSSDGTYSNDTRTITVSLGDLDPAEEGVLYVQGEVDSLDRNNAQVVTTALLVYTSSKGAQENAIAYVLNNPNYNNSLSAAAFFSGFFGMSLIGWLLLIIIILLIILIVRRYYYNRYERPYDNNEIQH